MRGEPLPKPGSVKPRERRRAACVQAREGTQPDAPEEMREVVPAVRAQQVGHGGVLEDARRRLGEDPVARERAQDAIQRVRVGACVARELIDAAWAAGQGVRDSEVGRECERARHKRAAERVPEDGLRTTCAHARATATSSSVPVATPPRPPARRSGNTAKLNDFDTSAKIRHTDRHGRPTFPNAAPPA
jgi:hypothetical protein